MEDNVQKKKTIYLEVLRIIAIYFVIFNHTNNRGFTYFTEVGYSIQYWIYMCFSIICGISVPIFFMISGATLIKKDEEIVDIFKKRILRILIVIILFSAVNYVLLYFKGNIEVLSLKEFFVTVYSKNMIVPYWYLYSYLGFLILLPFLRKLIINLKEKEFKYLITLYVVFVGIVPILQYILFKGTVTLNPNFNISMITTNILFYPAIGYYFSNIKLSWKQIAQLLICTAVTMAITCYMTNYRIIMTGEITESKVGMFFGNLRVFLIISTFVVVKKICEQYNISNFLEKAIVSIGSCTFGIYLIEQTLRENLYFVYYYMCSYMPKFLAILIYTGLIMLIGYGIVYILKRIPLINKII